MFRACGDAPSMSAVLCAWSGRPTVYCGIRFLGRMPGSSSAAVCVMPRALGSTALLAAGHGGLVLQLMAAPGGVDGSLLLLVASFKC